MLITKITVIRENTMNDIVNDKSSELVPGAPRSFSIGENGNVMVIDNNYNTVGNNDFDKNDEVLLWLDNKCELPQYFNSFKMNGFESLALVGAIEKKSDLHDIGIVLIGHQTKIWLEIKKLKFQQYLVSDDEIVVE